MTQPETPLPLWPGPDRGFSEPWQAELVALTVALSEQGVFGWTEWSERLGASLRDGLPDGSDYFERWLAAFEALLAERGIAGAPEVEAVANAWRRAAEATPHGQPIVLENDPGR